MRLFLSSYGVGNNPKKLIDLVEENRRVAVIANSGDYKPQSERLERLEIEFQSLKLLGLLPEELDLRIYFEDNSKLQNELKKFELVWIRGGNVFILRRAMAQSGFDKIILNMLSNDEIVYGGYSAAACVLGPTLKGYSIVDDPNIVPFGYLKPIIWEGLGLLPYCIEPHYKSDHPESADVDKEIEFLKKHKMPYKTLRDGEVIIVDGDKIEIIS